MVDLENLRRQIFASAVGSITATLALNPIGVLKVRAQAGQGKLPQIVKKILRDSGLIGFWTGARLGMIQSLPSTIVYMTSYENIRDVLVQSLPESSRFAAPGIAGGLARSIVVTALAPLELIRMLQLGGSNESMVEIAKDIYRRSGLSGFYRGWSSSLLRDTPFSIVYWMCFDQLRGVYRPLIGDSQHTSPLVNFISGSTSGTIAAILTHPFDVLKTQYQLSIKQGLIQNVEVTSQVSKLAAGGEQEVCKVISECCCPCTCRLEPPSAPQVERPKLSIVDGLSHILKTRGVSGLFRGLTMRLATIIPGSGIMITTYEFAKTLHLQ